MLGSGSLCLSEANGISPGLFHILSWRKVVQEETRLAQASVLLLPLGPQSSALVAVTHCESSGSRGEAKQPRMQTTSQKA